MPGLAAFAAEWGLLPPLPSDMGDTREGVITTPRAASAQWGFLCHPGHPSLAPGCVGDRGRGKACPRGLTRMFLRQDSLPGSGSKWRSSGRWRRRSLWTLGSHVPTKWGPAASATGLGC